MLSNFLQLFKTKNPQIIYTKEYRNGYNKLWINNIANYTP